MATRSILSGELDRAGPRAAVDRPVRALPPRPDWFRLTLGGLAMLAGAAAGAFVASGLNPLLVVVLLVAIVALLVTISHAEWGLLALVFIIYTRFSMVMKVYHGLPSIIEPLVLLLVTAVLIRWVMHRQLPAGWARPALLLGGYGLVGVFSYFYARDPSVVQTGTIEYLQDVLATALVIVLVQRAGTLRRVVWILLAAGIFLGTLAVYQQVTGTFTADYWGFGQAVLAQIVGETEGYRITGPFGNPNVFAHLMVPLVPLALDRLWNERRRRLRLLAGWAFAAATLTIVFTFSRQGFIGLVVVLALMLVQRPPRLPALLITLALVIPLFQLLPETYQSRLQTLGGIIPGSGSDPLTEASFRGRISENTVGWLMFLDHPVLGVGLDHYSLYYQDYSRQLGIDPRREDRAAHNLLIEIAAEKGLVGLSVFALLVGTLFRGLWMAQREFQEAGLPDQAGIAVALSVAMAGFFAQSMFRGLSHPSFFWLLTGIALAVPAVARQEWLVRQTPAAPRPQ